MQGQDLDPTRSEWEPGCCALCGAAISEAERGYAFGSDNQLCASCALARGGKWDEARDCWTRPPDVSGLPDEAYGASPHERTRRRGDG